MTKKIVFILGILIIYCTHLVAQQYTAEQFWRMENDLGYKSLQQRQSAGESLSMEDKDYLAKYKSKLDAYFIQMSDEQKSVYYKNRTRWTERSELVGVLATQEEDQAYSGERSTYSKYLVASGSYGFLYGLAADAIFEIDGAGAAGFPLVLAGASSIIPVFSIKDKKVPVNSFLLSMHGKAIGAFQGAALGFLLTGNNVDNFDLSGKLTLGLAIASSIGLGRLGYSFGRTKPWTEGRVALYSHYGWLMPLEGIALAGAFESEDVRMYAASSLIFGAGGYLIANRVANGCDYTRGDVTAIQTLTLLNTGLGLGIMLEGDVNSSAEVLIPAIGALGGTFAGQRWLRNVMLTNQQGRNALLAASGGALIGEGIAIIINSESITPYYLIPYLTGMTTYSLLIEKYRHKNVTTFRNPEKTGRWDVNLMPQNIFLNKKLASSRMMQSGHYSNRFGMLPLFSATYCFK
jgi:hypothetical protein